VIEDIFIKNNCIYVKSGEEEKKLTNWVPEVLGAVCTNGTLEGFIFQHAPCTEQDNNKRK